MIMKKGILVSQTMQESYYSFIKINSVSHVYCVFLSLSKTESSAVNSFNTFMKNYKIKENCALKERIILYL